MDIKRYLPDRITTGLIITVIIASFLPCEGKVYDVFNSLTDVVVALLFFLHGVKLSRQAAWEGLTHWRLHLFVLAFTFIFFPFVGLILRPVLVPLIGEPLYIGFLFLCVCPSTVQSSIAFTSLAKGNVAAAVCAASASSILGIFLTPILTEFLVFSGAEGIITWDSVIKITMLLLFPFVLGQVVRPWFGPFIQRHKYVISWVDQLSILLIVYTAFSNAVTEGLWTHVPILTLVKLVLISVVVLSVALVLSFKISSWLGFNWADRITIMFCGSKKSLASGVPMMRVLVPASQLGVMVLPLMIFHQVQLMVCAYLANKFSKHKEVNK